MGRYTMRFLPRIFVVGVALVACATVSAQSSKYEGIGTPATPEEIAKLDYSINPITMQELPPGKGTAKEGAPVFAAKCAVCHGPTGQESGVLGPRIVGAKGTRAGFKRGRLLPPFGTSSTVPCPGLTKERLRTTRFTP